MDSVFSFVAQLFGRVDNVAILVLIVFVTLLAWAHVVWRKEEREDRRQLLDLISKNTEALNGVKLALTLLIGRPLP